MLRPVRKAVVAALHDALMALASFPLALYLRLGADFNPALPMVGAGTLVFTLIAFAVFAFYRLHRRSWRYVSTSDLLALTEAVTAAVLCFLLAMFLYNRLEGMPRSAFFIQWCVLLALLGGPRFLYRMFRERTFSVTGRVSPARKIPVLLVGINDHTELFLRETANNPLSGYRVVGLLDNDRTRAGQFVRNVKVYGAVSGLARTVEKLRRKGNAPQKVVVSGELFDGPAMHRLLKACDGLGLTLARLPRLSDLKQGEAEALEIRPVALEDLLGRPQQVLDRDSMRRMIAGKRVLVTGAGGTIGGELTRQIAGYGPEHLTLLECSEHNLYQIDKELEEQYPGIARVPVIGDVRDREALARAFARFSPQLVFHAAALKHVPMSELNVCEAVLTNVIGTKNVADLCIERGVETMVMISTDKAVNPTNAMGATKRLAERYVQSVAGTGATRFATIRFGNVLGSSGSVIPLFRRQLARGGPLTVTHPDITRYFMTVREAVELVLQAAALPPSPQSGVHVLDMGEPMKIKDLAEQLVRLAGLKPGADVKIEYTGLRPGEKLYEELFYEAEERLSTAHEGISLAVSAPVDAVALKKALTALQTASNQGNDRKARELLKRAVPEYAA